MAGRLNIAITGIQDVYLTGSPEMSHFVNRFKRHTKFTTQTIEVPFNGDPERGKTNIAIVPTTAGDMISNISLKIYVDRDATSNVYDSFVKSNIDYIDLFMGKQHIDRLTTDYIMMYHKLRSKETEDNEILYRDSYNTESHFSSRVPLYLDLPFYFYKHPHLAIPVCAMYKHSLEIHIQMKKPIEFRTDYMPIDYSENLKISNMSLNVDYHYLSEIERNFFKTRPIEYIITQTQKTQRQIESSDIDKEHSFITKFKHPVREFFFFLQHDAWKNLTNRSNINEELDYANMKINNEILFTGNHRELSSKQFLNRYESPSDIVEEYLIWNRDSSHYNQTFIPLNDILTSNAVRNLPGTNLALQGMSGISRGLFKTFEVKNGLFYNHSLSMNPSKHEPSGELNMSRIVHQQFTFKFKTPDKNSIYSVWNDLYRSTFQLYAVNYNILVFEDGLCGLKY